MYTTILIQCCSLKLNSHWYFEHRYVGRCISHTLSPPAEVGAFFAVSWRIISIFETCFC
jgi:hypothetical protein